MIAIIGTAFNILVIKFSDLFTLKYKQLVHVYCFIWVLIIVLLLLSLSFFITNIVISNT